MWTTKLLVPVLSIAATVLTTPSSSLGRPLEKTYGKLPMSFERNVGQSRAQADFIARGAGYSVLLAPGEAVLALRKQTPSGRASGHPRVLSGSIKRVHSIAK